MEPEDYRVFCYFIRKNDLTQVQKFLNESAEFFRNFNQNSESPAAIALQNEHYEIYDLLLSHGFTLSQNDDLNEITKDFSEDSKRQIRKIHSKHSKSSNLQHLIFLSSRTKLSHDAPDDEIKEFNKSILNAYGELNEIEDIKPILEIVATAEDFEIQIDLQRSSVMFMNPSAGNETLGIVYPSRGEVFVGAVGLRQGKEEMLDTLGVISHEFFHYALKLTYDNKCKPYCKGETEKEEKFKQILKSSLDKRDNEPLIEIVFDYPESEQEAELIVRPAQLIVLYQNNQEKFKKCCEDFHDLFEFYQETLEDLRRELPLMKSRSKLNKRFEVLNNLKMSDDALESFEANNDILKAIKSKMIESNCPSLTMQAIYHSNKDYEHFDSLLIFVKLEDIKNDEIFEQITEAYRLITNPKFIISCIDSENQEVLAIAEKLKLNNLTERMIFIVDKSFCHDKFPLNADALKINHRWKDFNDNFLQKNLNKNVEFQGKEITLRKLVDPETFLNFPKNLFADKMMKISQKLAFDEIDVYIDRKMIPKDAKQVFVKGTNNEFIETGNYEIEYDSQEFLTKVKNFKTILITGDFKSGKSTELQMIAKRLKEKFHDKWIVLWESKLAKSVNDKKVWEDTDFSQNSIEFIRKKILKLNEFESEMFNHLLRSGDVIFLVDNLQDFQEDYKNFIIKFMKYVVKETKNHLIITATTQLAQDIRKILHPEIFKIKLFTQNDQKVFCQLHMKSRPDKDEVLEKINEFLCRVWKSVFFCPGDLLTMIQFLRKNPVEHLKAEIFHEGFEKINGSGSYDHYETNNACSKPLERQISDGSTSNDQSDVHNLFPASTATNNSIVIEKKPASLIPSNPLSELASIPNVAMALPIVFKPLLNVRHGLDFPLNALKIYRLLSKK